MLLVKITECVDAARLPSKCFGEKKYGKESIISLPFAWSREK